MKGLNIAFVLVRCIPLSDFYVSEWLLVGTKILYNMLLIQQRENVYCYYVVVM